jgi:citrate lyase beta subunit
MPFAGSGSAAAGQSTLPRYRSSTQAIMPTPEQLEAARRLVERYDGGLDQGVGVYVDEDGQMVDEAVVRGARRILARARRTAEKSGLL